MLKERDNSDFATLGADIKESRKVLGLSRRSLAEFVNIDPRYLANIENSGSLPSLPVFHQLVNICKLPVERYFFPYSEEQTDSQRDRINLKLNLCPYQYLPIIEAALDGAIKIQEQADSK